ncbi:Papain-like_cysteine peptidase superfamily [Hexamita inflata]|uniref:Papain-like cysteine peptidase superfamily n=1 Tax=Hexamita inflata TaxID=28002 RepID=A0AA86NGT2_9EUKA|nr:Papain-like cysteine peptidase superfamily [Hexamita inflata]
MSGQKSEQNVQLKAQVIQESFIDEISCKTVPELTVILYSGPALFRVAQYFNTIPNPLKVTHCGVVVHMSGKQLHQMVNEGKFVHVKDSFIDVVKNGIRYDDDEVRPYSIEAHWPHVLITPLKETVAEYDGSVRMRKLIQTPPQFTNWVDMIGVHYEVKWWKMFFAEWRLNTTEDISSVFCSELAALLVKRAGLINVNSSNVLPEMMVTTAKKYDVLKGKYGEEEGLKILVPKKGCE